jgi:hypothetical protein
MVKARHAPGEFPELKEADLVPSVREEILEFLDAGAGKAYPPGEGEAHLVAAVLSVANYPSTVKAAREAAVAEARGIPSSTEESVEKRVLGFRMQAGLELIRQRHEVAARLIQKRRAIARGDKEHEASPWKDRPGWSSEENLPIHMVLKKGREEEEPIEPGYDLYNRLIGPLHYRPFRTATGEPRVAIPSSHGLEIRDPASQEFIDSVGYVHYTIKGEPVPIHDVQVASRALTGRALARSLPPERVVDLWLRFAPDVGDGHRIDMMDRRRRCVVLDAEGWRLEEVGHPTFDPRRHMLPLPDPVRAPGKDGDWTRVEDWWRFVPVQEGNGRVDMRLLLLADQVQLILGAAAPKTVKVIPGEEGSGKSTAAALLQALLDPSIVPLVKPPEDEDELINLAMNHAVVNMDNVSYIDAELSDNIARLSTGIGLVKRKLYSDSEEIALNVRRSVILNGITAAPRAADLLRRCLFLTIDPPKVQLSTEELDVEWKKAHPQILGGLLDLAVLTARVLRDSPPPPRVSTMPDYVRVGRAVAVAMGRTTEAFLVAWEQNVDLQLLAVTEDPWISLLSEYFGRMTPTSEPVRSEDISVWINQAREGVLRKPATPQAVGNAISRAQRTLRRLEIPIGTKVLRGHTVYFRGAPVGEQTQLPESGPPSPPSPPRPSSSGSERQDDREGGVVAPDSRGGPEKNEVHPAAGGPPSGVDLNFGSTLGPPTGPPSNSSPEEVVRGGLGGPLSTKSRELKGGDGGNEAPAGPDPEDLFEGRPTRAERAMRTWAVDHEAVRDGRTPSGAYRSSIGPFMDYPDGTVADRATQEILWRPGDPPEKRPVNPERGKSRKPHTKRSF